MNNQLTGLISFLANNRMSVVISSVVAKPSDLDPHYVEILLSPYGATGINEILSKSKDISRILGFNSIDISNGPNGTIRVECFKPPKTVVLDDSIVYEPFTAPIGVEISTGQPLVLDIRKPSSCHVGVFGMTGSGKTVMAQGFLDRLCKRSKMHDLSLVILDPKRDDNFASHVSKNVAIYASEANECLSAVREVARIIKARNEDRSIVSPRIIVYCDEFADMMNMCGNEMASHISRIASIGRSCNIHLILGTQHASRDQVDAIVKANLPMTVVGKVVDSIAARVCCGHSGSGAENLGGYGEFIAFAGGQKFHFKAPMFEPTNTGQVPQRYAVTQQVTNRSSQSSPDRTVQSSMRNARVARFVDLIKQAKESMPDFDAISRNELVRRMDLKDGSGNKIERIAGTTFTHDFNLAFNLATTQ